MKRKWRIWLAGIVIAVSILLIVVIRLMSSPSLQPYASLTLPVSAEPRSNVRAQFFGTATLLVSDGETSVMVDGFFSRHGFFNLLVGEIAPDEARIDTALRRGRVSKIEALLVAHSHYDHALDSAIVAKKTGALLVGSESTANIARGAEFSEDRIRIVKDRDALTVGAFQIVFFETPHSPDPAYPGNIEEPLRPPAKVSDYKLGKNYSFLLRHPRGNILIVPSANFIPGLFNDVKVDVVFLGIGSVGKQSDEFARTYWNEVVKNTGAKLVIPIHWDDFTRPLEEPIKPLPYLLDNMEDSMDMLLKLAQGDGVSIRLAPLFSPFVLPLNRAD